MAKERESRQTFSHILSVWLCFMFYVWISVSFRLFYFIFSTMINVNIETLCWNSAVIFQFIISFSGYFNYLISARTMFLLGRWFLFGVCLSSIVFQDFILIGGNIFLKMSLQNFLSYKFSRFWKCFFRFCVKICFVLNFL